MFRNLQGKKSGYAFTIIAITILFIVVTQWFPFAYIGALALFLLNISESKNNKKNLMLDILGLALLILVIWIVHFYIFM